MTSGILAHFNSEAPVAGAIYEVTLPALRGDVEYFVSVATPTGERLWPASAPERNHTVVVGP